MEGPWGNENNHGEERQGKGFRPPLRPAFYAPAKCWATGVPRGWRCERAGDAGQISLEMAILIHRQVMVVIGSGVEVGHKRRIWNGTPPRLRSARRPSVAKTLFRFHLVPKQSYANRIIECAQWGVYPIWHPRPSTRSWAARKNHNSLRSDCAAVRRATFSLVTTHCVQTAPASAAPEFLQGLRITDHETTRGQAAIQEDGRKGTRAARRSNSFSL